MKTIHFSIITGLGLFLLFLIPTSSAQALPYTLSSSIGGHGPGFDSPGSANGQLSSPRGITTNSTGYMFVTDSGNNRIQVFDSSGKWRESFGTLGTDNGQFNLPQGIAVNSTGFIFVADSGNNRIQVFDPTGKWKESFGGPGSANGQFNLPHGIAVNSAGYIFVADYMNHRIQIFDSSGKWRQTIGGNYNSSSIGIGPVGSGSANGEFNGPIGITVNSTGFIFVADSGNYRIQIFDSSGKWKQSIRGNFPGIGGYPKDQQVDAPVDVGVNGAGHIFFVDNSGSHVPIFDSSGNWEKTLGVPGWGQANGMFNSPFGIAINRTGFIFVADTGNNRIQVFDPSGNWQQTIGNSRTAYGNFIYPTGIAVNNTGFIFVAEYGNHRIQIFDPSGKWKQTIGTFGSIKGQFNSPRGVTVSRTGSIFVADSLNNRIQIFDSAGNWKKTIGGGQGSANGQFNGPQGITVSSTGSILVADSGNNRIQIFDSSGNWRQTIGGNGLGPFSSFGSSNATGQFNSPTGIALNNIGSIFVADTGNNRIQIFDPSGKWKQTIGGTGPGRSFCTGIGNGLGLGLCNPDGSGNATGEFHYPSGVAINSTGFIFVSDSGNRRIQIFDSAGIWKQTIDGNGLFSDPQGVALNSTGSIFVADFGNHIIQIFSDSTNSKTSNPISTVPEYPFAIIVMGMAIISTIVFYRIKPSKT